jgi:hypothetical protein
MRVSGEVRFEETVENDHKYALQRSLVMLCSMMRVSDKVWLEGRKSVYWNPDKKWSLLIGCSFVRVRGNIYLEVIKRSELKFPKECSFEK